MVYKNALKLVADGTVDKHRGNSGINTSGEAENHYIFSDLLLDFFDLGFNKSLGIDFLSVVHIFILL